MTANSAFLAAMTLLVLVFIVFGQLGFLAPNKGLIAARYPWTIVGALVLVFLNLFGVFYLVSRTVFLKETGRNSRTLRSSSTRRTRS